jgi:hypothetical protein
MITWIAAVSCLLAVIPAALFLRNLALYLPLPSRSANRTHCSVLIPARNEEDNIEAAVHSVLRSERADLEVIVLDDASTDRTAEIVSRIALTDSRVRVETAEILPAGWCGKNFACHQLARLARHPLLVFMDADVRISRHDSLARLGQFMEESDASLVSGVPREQTEGLMEQLIIPLIHFILLGFLPLERMRNSSDPRFAAACGQILAVRRDAYKQAGGHAAIAGRIHDAVALTRSMRASGFKTDLFDATDSFECRMYRDAGEVWNGFAKNAHEGLGSPQLIVPATLLLLGGQVFPFILLAFVTSPLALTFAAIATGAALFPRLVAVVRFRQSISSALLHPVGISVLVAIQWSALFRSSRRRPAVWKGRSYAPIRAT